MGRVLKSEGIFIIHLDQDPPDRYSVRDNRGALLSLERELDSASLDVRSRQSHGLLAPRQPPKRDDDSVLLPPVEGLVIGTHLRGTWEYFCTPRQPALSLDKHTRNQSYAMRWLDAGMGAPGPPKGGTGAVAFYPSI